MREFAPQTAGQHSERRFWRLFCVYVLAQTLDALGTLAVLRAGGREFNPVLFAAYLKHGLAGLFATKALCVTLVVCAARIAAIAHTPRCAPLAALILRTGALVGFALACVNLLALGALLSMR